MKTLLKGGSVVTGSGVKRADVLLEGEKILQVGRRVGGADQVVDVAGCLLFPGFIDAHTPAAAPRSGAAPPPSSTLPAPTRARACTRVWTSGTARPTARPSATTASI